jgi:hypothetical protein
LDIFLSASGFGREEVKSIVVESTNTGAKSSKVELIVFKEIICILSFCA